MTRQQVISEMIQKANNLIENWSRDGENEIWEMALDWNSEHPDETEIFMCEYSMDENGIETNRVTGFMIEDDYWLYEV